MNAIRQSTKSGWTFVPKDCINTAHMLIQQVSTLKKRLSNQINYLPKELVNHILFQVPVATQDLYKSTLVAAYGEDTCKHLYSWTNISAILARVHKREMESQVIAAQINTESKATERQVIILSMFLIKLTCFLEIKPQ